MVDFTYSTTHERIRSGPTYFKVSYDSVGALLATCDSFIVLAGSLLGGAVYQRTLDLGNLSPYVAIGMVTCLAYEFLAFAAGSYRLGTLVEARRDYGQILTAWLLAVLFLTLLLFLLKVGQQVSRGSIILFSTCVSVALVAWRFHAKRYILSALETGSIEGRRALLAGTRDELSSLQQRALLTSFGFREAERVVLPDPGADHSTMPQLIAMIDHAIKRSRACRVEKIVLAVPWRNDDYLDVLRQRLRVSPLSVQLLPDRRVSAIWQNTDSLAPLIDIQREALTRLEQALKRSVDLAVAVGGLVILLPLLIVFAVLIKLDSPGPTIFRQRRKGFDGAEFVIYKLRTMSVLEDSEQLTQAREHDPRVTRLGRLLRRWSIDELPQLINVLKGDMSVVGPRPHPICFDNQYGAPIREYAMRHHVKPGITGWAQINGHRGETPLLDNMKNRVEHDLWYINNWTFALDIKILLKTLVVLLDQRNAY
jgi:undecaprenyl-phosphate galactose phosphotransferase/putative colanic acid biosynthesis UDP-glucose lipid carrier transferase